MSAADLMEFSPEVAGARKSARPVVALESTIITHGVPYPRNVETAREVDMPMPMTALATQLFRSAAAAGLLDEDDLSYVLLSAERLTGMLAHLHIGRLLAQQAERWPERRPLAERFLRRTSDVCTLNARRIMRGDRDALEAIQQWHALATA